MDQIKSKPLNLVSAKFSLNSLSKPKDQPNIYNNILPLTSRTKYTGVRIRHPYICSKCRRFKLEGFFGSLPPKNFCICPANTLINSICLSPTSISLPSATQKNLIATGTSINTKTLENLTDSTLPKANFSVRRKDSKELTIKDEENSTLSINAERYKNKTLVPSVEKIQEEVNTLTPSFEKKEKNFKFLVFAGNNSKLVRKILLEMSGWSEGEFISIFEANFIWQPVPKNMNFRKLGSVVSPQVVNHFEKHFEISNKAYLFKNLCMFCKQHGRDVSSLVPATFLIDLMSKKLSAQIGHFMNCFRTLKGETKGKVGVESEVKQTVPDTHYTGRNVWLIKPADNNRGRGIKIFNTLSVFKSIISEYLSGMAIKKTGRSGKFVIQKYVESPLLIDQRKFDIRVWVLITQDLQAYFYKEGYIRTSSELFSLDDSSLDSIYVHLTNNAIQKESIQYSKYEKGNQLSFDHFKNYFASDPSFEFEKIINGIKEKLSVAISSAIKKINPHNYKGCFEIFGFDFMLDSNFDIWLIEGNTNPCIELSSPLLEYLIPKMLGEAFALTLPSSIPTEDSQWELLTLIYN